jgi:hypothetical protein
MIYKMLVRRDSDQYILQLSKLPNEELVGAGTGSDPATSALTLQREFLLLSASSLWCRYKQQNNQQVCAYLQ